MVSSVSAPIPSRAARRPRTKPPAPWFLDPAQVQEVEQQRAVNIKAAYELSQRAAATPGWALSTPFIIDLHRLITHKLPHPDNRPGQLRDNPKGRITTVGDAPGGRYKPP